MGFRYVLALDNVNMFKWIVSHCSILFIVFRLLSREIVSRRQLASFGNSHTVHVPSDTFNSSVLLQHASNELLFPSQLAGFEIIIV